MIYLYFNSNPLFSNHKFLISETKTNRKQILNVSVTVFNNDRKWEAKSTLLKSDVLILSYEK